MKMGAKQRWSSFSPQWSNKLTESHGDQWPDDVKISLLKGTLNHTLRAALTNNHLLPFNSYFEWIRIVVQIAQQHDELVGNSDAFVKFEARANHQTRSQKAERSGNGIALGGLENQEDQVQSVDILERLIHQEMPSCVELTRQGY